MHAWMGRSTAPLALALAVLVVVGACTGSAGGPSGRTVDPPRTSTPASGAPPTTSASGSSDPSAAAPAGVLDQAWATASLVDVATGGAFRIADHAGKVILLETMAIWCTNCRSQQISVDAALARLPADGVVYIVLDVDPNESAPSLAEYREQNGFGGRYAVASTEVARALAADFGDQFLNPPSTPIVVVGTDGTVTLTNFGQKSADEIVALVHAGGA
jgi:thiol-disulfide isomerase/thioredoxin